MYFVSETPTSSEQPDKPRGCVTENGENCDSYLGVLLLYLIALMLLSFSCAMCSKIARKRRRRFEQEADTDVFYPRFNDQRGNHNHGFADPPPRYDQIFKRGGPSVITTTTPPTRPSDDTAPPPSYSQVTVISEDRSRAQPEIVLSVSSNLQTTASVVDMEHPSMPTRTSTIDEMENSVTAISNHAQSCLQRYDSSHADAILNIDAPPPPAGGPPGYEPHNPIGDTTQ